MDAKKSPTNSLSGLKSVRARAQKQTHVKLKRSEADETAEPRNSWQGIKTLKNKVAEEEERPESAEPSILAKMWSNLQELLGNR